MAQASSITNYPTLLFKKAFENELRRLGTLVNVDNFKSDVTKEVQSVVIGITSEYQEPTSMQRHQFVDVTTTIGLFTQHDALALAEVMEEVKKIDFVTQKELINDFKINRMWVMSDEINFSETDSEGNVQGTITFNIQYLKV